MIAEIEIISERENSFTGKRGKVEQTIIACVDRCAGPKFINTFDYVLSDDEREKHRGKLEGKKATLGLINARPEFGGRLRFEGEIVKIH